MSIQVQCAGGQSYGRKLGAHDQNSEECDARSTHREEKQQARQFRTQSTLIQMYVHSKLKATDNPTDTSAEPVFLTPNNLLTMKDTTVQPPPPGYFQDCEMYCQKRWRRIQYLAEQFWSRWKVEYLQTLQQRFKWSKPQRDLAVDDVVLVVKASQPRSTWQLVRVAMVSHSQTDGLVRNVWIKTGTGQHLEWPIHKLILLVTCNEKWFSLWLFCVLLVCFLCTLATTLQLSSIPFFCLLPFFKIAKRFWGEC